MIKSILLSCIGVLIFYVFACGGNFEPVKVLPPDNAAQNNNNNNGDGGDPNPRPNPRPNPEPEPKPEPNPGGDVTYAEIAPIIDDGCLGAACHDSPGVKGIGLDSETQLRFHYNDAMRTIQTNRMPVGRPPLSPTEIELLQKWFNGT